MVSRNIPQDWGAWREGFLGAQKLAVVYLVQINMSLTVGVDDLSKGGCWAFSSSGNALQLPSRVGIHLGHFWWEKCTRKMVPFQKLALCFQGQNVELHHIDDETLPIINKPKHQKRGNTRNKMEGSTFKKTKEPPKRANHKGNIKFLNPLLSCTFEETWCTYTQNLNYISAIHL